MGVAVAFMPRRWPITRLAHSITRLWQTEVKSDSNPKRERDPWINN